MKEKRPSLFAASKAVALRWDGKGAPQITATGSGTTAEQILQIAEAHDIPLQSDPALVEALAQIRSLSGSPRFWRGSTERGIGKAPE